MSNFARAPQSKKPGFLEFLRCHQEFSQKPGFWPRHGNYNKRAVKRGQPMVTSLNVNTALLQEAIELEREIAIETLVEIALREYIQRRKQPQHLELSFGESLGAFREKYQLHELGLNPDEIWGEIRDRTFVGREVIFE
ncbi:MAG: type II toxin-antitoxin system VapB family antitoxin [Microcoleus sp.]